MLLPEHSYQPSKGLIKLSIASVCSNFFSHPKHFMVRQINLWYFLLSMC